MTATEAALRENTTTPAWSGVNHLALITSDMDATVRFYHGVLGARLVFAIGNDSFRHYFFEFGPQCTIAFFEYVGLALEHPAKPSGVPDPRFFQFDHLSLNLPDEAALLDLRQRLQAADCEITEVVDHGAMHSVYFTDPNGIALEASWWVQQVTGRPEDYHHELYADPDPVPALRELQETGTLTVGPGTRLV
jgi:catechol 2,3-dioxygenase-like lactoylglutathione lyase family enzyme